MLERQIHDAWRAHYADCLYSCNRLLERCEILKFVNPFSLLPVLPNFEIIADSNGRVPDFNSISLKPITNTVFSALSSLNSPKRASLVPSASMPLFASSLAHHSLRSNSFTSVSKIHTDLISSAAIKTIFNVDICKNEEIIPEDFKNIDKKLINVSYNPSDKNLILCSLCHNYIYGMITICLKCYHGGHYSHMKDWFESNLECSYGCGCLCNKN